MAFIGTPIANGDGSYTFQTDTGEPLVLRGDSAQRAFNASQAAAPTPSAPTMPANDAMEQAYAAPPAQLAQMGPMGNPVLAPGQESAARDAGKRSIADVGNSVFGWAYKNGKPFEGTPAAAPPQPAPAAAPAPNPEAPPPMLARPPEGKAGKAVFYEPPQSPGVPAPASGGGRPGAVKAVPVQQTLQGTMPLSDEQQAEAKRAQQGRYEAAEGVTNVAVKRAEEEAKVRTGIVEANQNAEVDMQAREAERKRVIGDKLAQVDKLAQEAAAGKIQDYWADKSAETKFATAILQGVSAWAEGMGGGKAYAIQNVKDAIDQDYKVQAANLENKHRALAAQTNILGHLREEFGDREAAMHAFHAMKLATAGAQLEEINARNLPAEQKAKLAEFAAGLNADYVNSMQAGGRIAYSRIEKFAGPGGGGPAQAYVNSDGSFLDLPDGTSIKAANPDMLNKWNEQLGAIDEATDSSKKLRALLAKGPSVQNAAAAQLLVNNMATSVGAAKLGSARQTGMGELENLQHIFNQGGSIASDVWGRTAATLDVFDSSMKHARKHIFGAAPRYSNAIPNGKGGLVRYQLGGPQVPAQGGEVQIQPAEEK